jgi:hypothetical protein
MSSPPESSPTAVPSSSILDPNPVDHSSDHEDDVNEEFAAPELDIDVATDRNLVPVDDDTYTMMRKRQMGAAVMFVPDANPQWRVSYSPQTTS